jgi:hypothetical protein
MFQDTPKENLNIVASLFEQLFRDIPSYVERFFFDLRAA